MNNRHSLGVDRMSLDSCLWHCQSQSLILVFPLFKSVCFVSNLCDTDIFLKSSIQFSLLLFLSLFIPKYIFSKFSSQLILLFFFNKLFPNFHNYQTTHFPTHQNHRKAPHAPTRPLASTVVSVLITSRRENPRVL